MVEASERKRPVGIAVFGWLVIVSSILNVTALMDDLYWQTFPLASSYFYILITPLSVVVGIFLLRVKNWARLAIIAISVLVFAESVITAPSINQYFERTMQDVMKEIDTEGLIEESVQLQREQITQTQGPGATVSDEELAKISREMMEKVIRYFAYAVFILFGLISLGFNLSVIYYFTRPRIRGSFT